MRPRISVKEATYILEVLKAQLPIMKERYARYEWLKLEVPRLRYMLLYESSSQAFKEGWKDKKEELKNLELESYALYNQLDIHEQLIRKYQAISECQPHDGRYKRFSNQIHTSLLIYSPQSVSEKEVSK